MVKPSRYLKSVLRIINKAYPVDGVDLVEECPIGKRGDLLADFIHHEVKDALMIDTDVHKAEFVSLSDAIFTAGLKLYKASEHLEAIFDVLDALDAKLPPEKEEK